MTLILATWNMELVTKNASLDALSHRGGLKMFKMKLNKLNGHAKEGIVCAIHKKTGDEIDKGETLLEIESNKGNMSVEAEGAGKILSIEVEVGAKVKIGDVLAEIEGEVSESKEVKNRGKFNYFGSLIKPQKKEIDTDITIIGGGPGGYVTALQAAKSGSKVVLIEKEKLGGTCLNLGCIPTKCFVRSSEVFENLKEAGKYGLHAENVSVDMKKVVERKNKVVDQLVNGIKYLLDKNNVQVIQGEGKIINKETVYVKERNTENTIKTKNIIIATGSETANLPIPGINLENVITSNEALDIKKLPKSLVIVGGGIIGMEFAFIFNSFGVEVSVIEYLDNILSVLDEDVYEEISNIAKEKGIKVYTGSKVEEIMEDENKGCIVAFTKDDKKKFICSEKVLMAVGRKPNLGNLDIEELGIELNDNKRGIKVNEKMQTSVSNIYAIGDVTNKIQLAHVASHQGIIAVKNILGESIDMDYDVIPSAIFTNPEIAVVGLSEKQAKDKDLDIQVGKFPFEANGKALTLGESKGFIKIIKDQATDKIIGGAIIGPHATDLIAEIALALKNGLKSEDIIETIHAHPTTAEAVHESALAAEGGAIHFG